MSVYVSPLATCERTLTWRYDQAARLLADSAGELHDFAQRIRLPPDGYHRGPVPYYDITAGKRMHAINSGAAPMTADELIERIRSVNNTAGA